MNATLSLLRILLKVGLPAYLVLMVGSALYGYLSPWKPAQEVIAEHAGQTPITVGLGYSAPREAPRDGLKASRTYVFFPEFLWDPKVVTVSEVEDDAPVALDSRITFWLNLMWGVVALYGTWFFWLRRTRKGVT